MRAKPWSSASGRRCSSGFDRPHRPFRSAARRANRWVMDYDDGWTWQWVPTGLIYHSYMAGPHEPRAGITAFSDGDDGAFADATLGGRDGLLRIRQLRPGASGRLAARFLWGRDRTARPQEQRRLGFVRLCIRLAAHVRQRAVAIQVRLRAPELALGRRIHGQPSRARSSELRSRLAGVRHVVFPDSGVAGLRRGRAWRSITTAARVRGRRSSARSFRVLARRGTT